MNKNTYMHYTILCELHKFYETNVSKFTTYSLIIALFGLLELNRLILHDLGVDQGQDNTGSTVDKKLDKIALAGAIIEISDPMAAYYKNKKDLASYELMNFTEAKLIKMRPEKILQVSDAVKKFYNEHILELDGTGIKSAFMTKLEEKNTAFNSKANLPNELIKARTIITKYITKIDKEDTDIITTQLNRAMKVFKTSDPLLFDSYTKLAEITHEGVHYHNIIVTKAPVSLSVVHDLTGEPLAEIPVKFSGIKGTFKTNAEGKILVNLPLGAYLGKIAFIDFIAQSFSFTLTEEGYELIIRMVPVGI